MRTIPIHPQLMDWEILSSWMVRFSVENGYNLHTFYHKVLGLSESIWNRDVDSHCSAGLIQALSEYSTISERDLYLASLKGFEGVLFESIGVASTNFILPLGIRHRKHNRKAMQFCPKCLVCDSVVFYRSVWRLAFIFVCEKHECFLRDSCSNCGSPVSFHRNAIGGKRSIPSRHLDLCFNCNSRLSLQAAHPIQKVFSNELISSYMRIVSSIVSKDMSREFYFGLKPLFFFKLLRYVIHYLTTRVGKPIYFYYLDLLNICPVRGFGVEFEKKDKVDRASLTLVAIKVIEDWSEHESSCDPSLGFVEYKVKKLRLVEDWK